MPHNESFYFLTMLNFCDNSIEVNNMAVLQTNKKKSYIEIENIIFQLR